MPPHSGRSPKRTLEDHLRRIRGEFPQIRPYEEEDDGNCWNEGLEALTASQLNRAERIFKKLVLAQPEHFDGYYGLAQVYQRRQRVDQAVLFADEAIVSARPFWLTARWTPIPCWNSNDFGSNSSRPPALLRDDKKPPSLKAAFACAPIISAGLGPFLLKQAGR